MPSWDEDKANLKTAGGSIAGIFGGLGSYLGPNHKVLAFSLAATGVMFLIGTIWLQMSNRTHASKVTHALIALATVTFIYFGYNEARRPVAATPTNPSSQQQKPPATNPVIMTPAQSSPVTNSAVSSGDGAPATAGSNNVVVYNDSPPKAPKRRQ